MKHRLFFWTLSLFLIVLTLASGVSGEPSDNIVAAWNFDENTGSVVADVSGNGWDGDFVNSPTWTAGKIGYAVNFQETGASTGSTIDIDGSSSGNLSFTGDFTITGWFNLDSLTGNTGGGEGLIGKSGSASTNQQQYVVWYADSDQTVRLRLANAAGTEQNAQTPDAVPSAGTWHFFAARMNGTCMQIRLNGGAFSSCTTFTGSRTTSGNDLALGRFHPNYAYMDGSLDAIQMFNAAKSDTDIDFIYNNGTGRQYPFASANITITVTDSWDDSAVNNVTATLLGETFTNTTGNIIYTNISQNDSLLVDINLTGEDYFSRSFISQNISSNLALELFQSEISFNASQLFTGDTISGATFTIDGNTDNPKYLSAGSYTVTASKAGYYSKDFNFTVSALDNKTITVENMSDAVLNITAVNAFSGISIQNFTVVATSGNYSVTGTADGSVLLLSVIQDLNYTLFWTKADYINDSYVLTVNNSVENVTFYSYESVSFQLNFYDEQTLEAVNNVSFDILSTVFSNSFNTGAGNDILLTSLPQSIYEIRYSARNYTERSYYVVVPVSNPSLANLSLYLLDEEDGQLFIRTVTDQGNNPLAGYFLQVQRPYASDDNTSLIYRTVEIASIDDQGESVFSAVPNTQQYRFRILDENLALFNTKASSYLVDTSSNIIGVDSGTNMENFNAFNQISKSLTYDNLSEAFVLDYTAPASVFRVCLVVTNSSGLFESNASVCDDSNSGTLTYFVNPNLNSTYLAEAYAYIGNDVFLFDTEDKDFSFAASRGVVSFIGAFLYVILMLLCIGMGGFVNPVPAVVLGVLGTAAFGLSFLGLFTVATYLTGGLLVLGIIILALLWGGS